MNKVCIVTGSRAEYGLLKKLITELDQAEKINLQLVVTGMHLAPEFGSTWKIIQKDGFTIDEKVENLLSSDTVGGVSKAIGLGVIGFSDVFERLTPDIIILLGDRFEILSAAIASCIANIPIAHLHGGELTEGLYDDSIRHSITKMSRYHFTSHEIYKQRVIQMGEQPSCVFNVGAFGLDSIKETKMLSKKDLEKELNFKFGEKNLLVTFHPETITEEDPHKQINELISALDEWNANIIFTMPNADSFGRSLAAAIKRFVHLDPLRRCVHTSLGQVKYFSALSLVDGVVGNSSSGLIEAPSFKKGTINIGSRQQGRLKAESVIDCGATKVEILTALETLYSMKFQKKISQQKNPYDNGGASKKVLKFLKEWDPSIGLKKFYDLN